MTAQQKTNYMERYQQKMRDVPREERRSMFRPENLSETERRQMRENMGAAREEQMLAEARAFFQLSPEEQEAYWEKRFQEREERWGQMRERRREAEKSGEVRPEGERRRGEGRGDGKGEGRGEGRGGPWGRGPRGGADQMQKRQQERLSQSSHEDRAILSEYFRRMREAMQKRYPERAR
jgi:hypothetical protein